MVAWMLAAVVLAAFSYGVFAAVVGKREALARLFGPVRREPVDFETLRLKSSPNQFLMTPEGFGPARPHAVSPVFEVPADRLRDLWLSLLDSQPRTTLVSSDPGTNQYEFEASTPLFGFPDAVTVRFLPLPDDRSTVAVYSRSHYGRSDLGANRERIEAWLGELRRRTDPDAP